jgi:hypothetical protein
VRPAEAPVRPDDALDGSNIELLDGDLEILR